MIGRSLFGRCFSLSLVALATSLTATPAQAEADTFGVGNGQDGVKTAVGNEVVNAYAPLTQNVAAGGVQLSIGTTIGAGTFAVNDLVMVLRATGLSNAAAQPPAIANRSSTRVNLATASDSSVGRYELARIQSVGTGTITLTKGLVNAFAKDVSQVIKVPEFTTVSVPAGTSLRALPWTTAGSGFAGGVLAFLANGTVTLASTGKLDADGAGFRGGEKVQRLANLPLGCPNEDGTPADGYADKGEGVVSSEFGATKGGRGNWSLAAGGGNCAETGGGGGGNGGSGGAGGDSFLTSGRGGRGGVGLDYSLTQRLTFGGGGGAGEQKNGVGSSGGRGGGAIFVRAQTIAGTGIASANGETAANAGILTLESDGAGGGGAGGSIVLRAVTNVDCGGVPARGGNGGDTAVVGVGFWGPGGGGGGGRVLIQGTTVGANCVANVSPGSGGKSGLTDRGATGGQNGSTQPVPGPYCFANPTAACADPQPVCDVPNGSCAKCDGPFDGTSSLACPIANEPVCLATGACVPCNGDLGSGATQSCQLAKSPTCLSGGNAGQCGKCTSNTDCQGAGHAGPNCNTATGACGTACTNDSDCQSTEWCAQSVCVAKTPNSEPVPNVPPINGECTPANGTRTCLSGVCEESDDLCGKKNSSPCGAPPECRSNICYPADSLCGKPIGETCANDAECRSDRCETGVCINPCNQDTDCPLGNVCDSTTNACVPGCRPGASPGDADADGVHGVCPNGQQCVAIDGGAIGECRPLDGGVSDGGDGGAERDATVDDGGDSSDSGNVDAGDNYRAGLVEGGGCACRTAVPTSASPLAFAGAAISLLLFARRRSQRSDSSSREK